MRNEESEKKVYVVIAENSRFLGATSDLEKALELEAHSGYDWAHIYEATVDGGFVRVLGAS